MQPTPEQVRAFITENLECDHIEVVGDGAHFEALIVSKAFEGLRTLHRHQVVYKALGSRMRADIHALSMRTLTPEEYQAKPNNG